MNPRASAGDTGSIPDLGISHMLGNWAQAPQQEKPLQWEACPQQLESSLRLSQLAKASSGEDPAQSKINKPLKNKINGQWGIPWWPSG